MTPWDEPPWDGPPHGTQSPWTAYQGRPGGCSQHTCHARAVNASTIPRTLSPSEDPKRAPQASEPHEKPAGPSQPRGPADLFWAFTFLALQGFGGVLAVAHRELVERRRWMSNEAYLQEVALSQALPGPNVCNLAVMFGDRCFGWRGAAAALAGLMTVPAGLLLLAVVAYTHWAGHALVEGALHGMGAVAAGTVAGTAFKLMGELRRHPLGAAVCLSMAAVVFGALAFLRWPIAPVILGLGGVGVSWTWWRLARQAVPHKEPGGPAP